jgi:S-adenosylmethionine synthetase
MTTRLFTSESVTEGHPDKMADQISDAILDDLLRQDPASRVAVETMLTTGQVHVSGEVTTEGYAEVMDLIRNVVLDIGYDHSEKGFDGESCGVQVSIGRQSPDIAQGVDDAFEERVEGSDDGLDRQGAGDQGLMFGFACTDTPELMPLPIHLAHQLAEQLTAVRKSGQLPYLRPDGKTQVTIGYQGTKAVSLDTIVVSSQHVEDVDLEGQLAPEVRNRRHLWRVRAPRRRGVLRQGSLEGRPVGHLCHALGCQERGRGRAGHQVRGPGGLRHRQGAPGWAVRRDLRHRRAAG